VLTNLTGRVQQLNNAINWARVESILLSHYTVGSSEYGGQNCPARRPGDLESAPSGV